MELPRDILLRIIKLFDIDTRLKLNIKPSKLIIPLTIITKITNVCINKNNKQKFYITTFYLNHNIHFSINTITKDIYIKESISHNYFY